MNDLINWYYVALGTSGFIVGYMYCKNRLADYVKASIGQAFHAGVTTGVKLADENAEVAELLLKEIKQTQGENK